MDSILSDEFKILNSLEIILTAFSKWRNMFIKVSSPDIGEGNGTPLQYSCLENPMDGGAWLVAVHGVDKSRV